ncbi:hypothetical protein AB1Y20_010501 [Prymnesium parvum]|uniref:Equilibrative nucleoside transporter 1 n=1 Tax=Prymnesium parvum TaxID=97485 RepID=A0AB34INS5_PRYPA
MLTNSEKLQREPRTESADDSNDSLSTSALPPADHCYFVWFIMYLQGVGALFPWNAFITPVDYFQLRFEGSSFKSSFESIFTTTFTLMGILTIIALQWAQEYVSVSTRIKGSLVLLLLIFAVVTLLAVLPLFKSDDTFLESLSDGAGFQFGILELCVGLSGMAVAVLTGSVTSYSSIYGSGAYIQAVVGGQGIAGLTVSLGNMLRSVPSVSNDCAGTQSDQLAHDREVVTGAAIYFGASCFVLFCCLVSFIHVEKIPFTRACLKQSEGLPPSPTMPSATDMDGMLLQRASGSSRLGSVPLLNHAACGEEAPEPYTQLAALAAPPRLARTLWKWCLSMTLIYTVTIALFPSLTANIESTGSGIAGQSDCLWSNPKSGLFGPFLFVMFNLGDTIGRNLPPSLSRVNVILALVACRVVFVPLFILCKSNSDDPLLPSLLNSSDAFPILVMLVFAVSNGWLTSCIFVHSASVVSPELRQRACTFIVLFLNSGLSIGAMLSFFTRWLMCRCSCNPFLAPNASAVN